MTEYPECPHDDVIYEPGDHEYQEVEICALCGAHLGVVDAAGEE